MEVYYVTSEVEDYLLTNRDLFADRFQLGADIFKTMTVSESVEMGHLNVHSSFFTKSLSDISSMFENLNFVSLTTTITELVRSNEATTRAECNREISAGIVEDYWAIPVTSLIINMSGFGTGEAYKYIKFYARQDEDMADFCDKYYKMSQRYYYEISTLRQKRNVYQSRYTFLFCIHFRIAATV